MIIGNLLVGAFSVLSQQPHTHTALPRHPNLVHYLSLPLTGTAALYLVIHAYDSIVHISTFSHLSPHCYTRDSPLLSQNSLITPFPECKGFGCIACIIFHMSTFQTPALSYTGQPPRLLTAFTTSPHFHL